MQNFESQPSPTNPSDIPRIVGQYPAIGLLADARSYTETNDGAELSGLSGEQLRSTKSIAVLGLMGRNDTYGLLGGNAERLQGGYAIYHDIVARGVTALSEGDPHLGAHRMATIMSIHDIGKSAIVAERVEEAHGVTDHDMALSALVRHNFNALDGAVEPAILKYLRSTVYGDRVLSNFFSRGRGITPAFNVGRHLQGEADYTLFEKTVREVDPVTLAEFTLDLLGSDGNTNPDGPVKFSDVPAAFNGIAKGLQKLSKAQISSASPEDTYSIWQELAYPSEDLKRLVLARRTPAMVAITRLAFMGREHQKPEDIARSNLDTLRAVYATLDGDTRQATVDALEDRRGLDLGFTPHVMDSMRQRVGTEPAYRHLMGIIAKISMSETVRSHSERPLTVNLDNKFDWSGLRPNGGVQVALSPPDANGIVNASFSI